MVNRRSSGVAVLAAYALALLSSCGLADLTMFPKTLTYTVAERDVYGDFRDAGLSGPVWVSRMELLSNGQGQSYLFLVASGFEGARLFVYDPDSLKLVKWFFETTLTSFLGVAPGGNFLCGGVEIDRSDLSVVSNARVTMGYGDARSIYDPLADTLHIFSPSGLGILYDLYDGAGWASQSPLAFGFLSISPSVSSVPYFASVHYDYGSTGAVRFLFGVQTGLLSCEVASVAGLSVAWGSSDLAAASSSSVSVSAQYNGNGAWLTRGGILRLSYEDRPRVYRHSLSDGGRLDHFSLEEQRGELSIAFYGSGDRWAELDGETEKLRLLRTWW